jgi:hypothetical protein
MDRDVRVCRRLTAGPAFENDLLRSLLQGIEPGLEIVD